MGMSHPDRRTTRAAGRADDSRALAPALVSGAAAGAALEPIVNISPPVLSGTPQVGERVRTTARRPGPPRADLRYQWLRDGSPIAGATSRGYRIRVEDLGSALSAEVTATDATDQTGTATPTRRHRSAAGRLEVLQRPAISGVARYDHRLTADAGRWAPKATKVRYQWLRSGVPIAGATKTSYRPGSRGRWGSG